MGTKTVLWSSIKVHRQLFHRQVFLNSNSKGEIKRWIISNICFAVPGSNSFIAFVQNESNVFVGTSDLIDWTFMWFTETLPHSELPDLVSCRIFIQFPEPSKHSSDHHRPTRPTLKDYTSKWIAFNHSLLSFCFHWRARVVLGSETKTMSIHQTSRQQFH